MKRSSARAGLVVLVIGLASSAPAAAAQVAAPATPASPPATAATDLISADRPGIADGSGVVGRGRLQLEVGFQREYRDLELFTLKASFLPTLVRVGLSARWEARVETNGLIWLERRDSMETAHSSGWSPASFGVKYQFLDATSPHGPSLGFIARASPPSGSGDFGAQRLTADVRLAADVDLTPQWSLNPNVGSGWYQSSDGRLFYATLFALTLSYAPTPRINPFIDIAFQGPSDIGLPSSVIIDGGLAYIIHPRIQLDVSVGSGAHGPAPRPFVSFGISVRSRR